MKKFSNLFEEMTSAESLFAAWFEFRKGKTSRKDVQEFGRHAERNILDFSVILPLKNISMGNTHHFLFMIQSFAISEKPAYGIA